VYDAWNQPVSLSTAGNLVVTCIYDGLEPGWRPGVFTSGDSFTETHHHLSLLRLAGIGGTGGVSPRTRSGSFVWGPPLHR